jgi:uncharacterized RDD family membrane protein YckC
MYDRPSLVPAGFGARLGGFLLDAILYGLFGLVFVAPALMLFRDAFDDCYRDFNDDIRCPAGALKGGSLAGGIAVLALGVLIVTFLYVRALGRTGQTWGRKIAGVRVVSVETGASIGVGRALGRYLFANFISGPVCYLGYLWMLWDGKHQTWHDKVVGSMVIRA